MGHILNIDDCDLAEALRVAAAFGKERYGYFVTPNVDHVIRHYRDQRFRSLYAQASLVLLDSRFLANTKKSVRIRRAASCGSPDEFHR
jgi:UDP-N-acetyl-D-mannosaminuronic acid transferase (WecB/TagA/CpsF family)